MGIRVHIAHKYDVDFHEADDVSVDEFLRNVDKLMEFDDGIVEWHDEENEMAWELNRNAVVNAAENMEIDEGIRVFLKKLLAQSNPDLDFMRIEFY